MITLVPTKFGTEFRSELTVVKAMGGTSHFDFLELSAARSPCVVVLTQVPSALLVSCTVRPIAYDFYPQAAIVHIPMSGHFSDRLLTN